VKTLEIDPISKHGDGDGAQSRLVMRPLGRTMSVVIRPVAFTSGTRQQWMTA